MSADNSEQEAFWAGEFGDAYIERNVGEAVIAADAHMFEAVLACTSPIASVLELGSNVGLNLQGLQRLMPEADFDGVEINARAFAALNQIDGITAHHSSIQEFYSTKTWDLVFTKTVMIHLDPAALEPVYDKLHALSRKYVVVAEYYSPTPVEVEYRGHSRKLFKRDFAGEMLEKFDDLKLLDYGFVYHRDQFPQDDVNWFLMEKSG
jgi:pseudaminic acid biosynthesis-associated methylase